MAHTNEDLLRRGYEAFATGDMDTLNEQFADDIVFHVAGRSPFAGDYKGKQEVFAFFGRLAQETEGTFRNEVHDILANDEHGVALVRTSGQRGGKSLEDNSVHVLHLENGKVKELWTHPGDLYAIDEFWS